ncbi:NAD(P)H:quinone oxidoreductase [Kitasatospora sp. NPDC056651]|uniref:NAD(P)H:quinone oxidoreductase n=1 Tax=Kitasatospora sp. NPDC056651 TaxID=3345892 RepID=UPI0036A7B2BB
MTNVAVIYYSSTGSVHTLATAAAEAAKKAEAEVRLRKVAELAPQGAIDSNPAWAAHHAETKDLEVASLEDLDWADVILFGTPTRFGLPAAQLKQFIDTAGGLWAQGKLANKVVTSFVSTSQTHGGQESTLLALNNTFYHWGAIIVPPGYTDGVQFNIKTGNPYGVGHVAYDNAAVDEATFAAIEHQTRRAVEIAGALKRGLSAA